MKNVWNTKNIEKNVREGVLKDKIVSVFWSLLIDCVWLTVHGSMCTVGDYITKLFLYDIYPNMQTMG